MKKLIPSLAALVGLFCAARADTITSTDNFNGSSLDSSAWFQKSPFGDSSVVVSGGNLTLTNRGGVMTKESFNTPVDVLMSFAFTGSIYDNFVVTLRTNDFLNYDPAHQDRGLVASFRMQSDPSDPAGTNNNVSLYTYSQATGHDYLGIGTYAINLGQSNVIRIRDTGSEVNLYINDLSNPFLTGSTTLGFGNQISFYNREGAGGGSSISAGSQVKIDLFSVTSNVPDGGTTALLLSLGLMGLSFTRRKKTAPPPCYLLK